MTDARAMPPSGIQTRPRLCVTLGRLAAEILRDYQRPEVQADYRRWLEERAAKAAVGTADE